ncbi:MAG: methyltransferase domain-containing protein [Terriglobia bacterium]
MVRTVPAKAESLRDHFEANTFHLTHARNCLDHSHSPLRAIKQMIEVTRPGGIVFLNHAVSEGENAGYRGLHQWNFQERHGDFVISAPGRRTVNVSQSLANLADVSAQLGTNNWLTVVVRKR